MSFSAFYFDDEFMTALASAVLSDQDVDVLFGLS